MLRREIDGMKVGETISRHPFKPGFVLFYGSRNIYYLRRSTQFLNLFQEIIPPMCGSPQACSFELISCINKGCMYVSPIRNFDSN